MKLIRVIKDTNFTTINNEFIFNKNMSLKAKGLLTHLLALPNDWKLYVEEVEKWHTDGKRAIYSAFNELKENGYLEREQIRKEGKIIRWDYIIYEKPQSSIVDIQNVDEENEDIQKRTLLNTNNTKDLNVLNTNNSKLEYPIELNLEAWEYWKKYRAEQFRSKYKPIGEKAAIKKLLKISENNLDTQALIIEQSIENSWRGLFALKEDKKPKLKAVLSEYKKGLEIINEQFKN